MADNYVEFSEVLTGLTDQERNWLQGQLEIIRVFDGQEYPDEALPKCFDPAKAEWHGCRGLRDFSEYDPEFIEEPEFQFQFENEDEEGDAEGSSLWVYSEDNGNIDQVCHIVRKFLKQFWPSEYWSLKFACTCSKPRVGEFSGGAVFVTADSIRWDNAEAFIEREQAAFAEVRLGKPQEFTDAGSTIVVNVSGGVIQDVFCSAPDVNALIVDWDVQDPSSPGVVNLNLDGRSCSAFVSESQAHPLDKLLNTDVEKAIQTAVQQGILDNRFPKPKRNPTCKTRVNWRRCWSPCGTGKNNLSRRDHLSPRVFHNLKHTSRSRPQRSTTYASGSTLAQTKTMGCASSVRSRDSILVVSRAFWHI